MATLDKYRRKAVAAGGVAKMAEADRRAYGRAVLASVRSSHRPSSALGYAAPCASRTWHSDGAAILAAVNSQNLAELQRDAAHERASRTPLTWKRLYEAAMEAKRSTMKDAAE